MHLSRYSLNVASRQLKSGLLPSFICSISTSPIIRVKSYYLSNHRCILNWIISPSKFRLYSTISNNDKTMSKNKIQNQSSSKQLGESTLLLQEGIEIQEVPLAILRDSWACKSNHSKPYIELDPTEEAAFVEGFKSFHSPREVLSILHTIPSQEVTPIVALCILRKLFELENNFGFRNEGKSWVITTENSSLETFARMAIVSRLIDILITGEDTSVLLDTLDILRYDRKAIAANLIQKSYEEDEVSLSQSDILEFSKYRVKLCDEVLIRTTKGQLSLEDVCRAVCTMGQMAHLFPNEIQPNFIDKMWFGISDKSHKISEQNIVSVFKSIQYFKKSQRLVMSIVEGKFISLWWKMNSATIAEICELLLMKDKLTGYNNNANTTQQYYWGIVSCRLLTSLSKSINMNLHQVSEEELLKVTKTFNVLNFYDATFEKTLSKYLKAKCLKITNPNLIMNIMDYVKKFRIRSPHIFEGVAEYFLLHNNSQHQQQHTATSLTPSQLTSILVPFGLLDYQPPQGIKFWEVVERLISENFVQISPKDVIDSLLSCVYLQKYPLNFVNKIFSPYFLDRLHTSEADVNVLHEVRSRLKLLDTALTLECGSKYSGPYLPRDFTVKSVYIDGRIIRMVNLLQEPLANIYQQSGYKVEPLVVLPNLPLNPLYIVDFILSAKVLTTFDKSTSQLIKVNDDNDVVKVPRQISGGKQLSSQVVLKNRFNLRKPDADYYVPIKGNGDYTAILIHIDTHYASDGKTLLGPQIMRIRHLKMLGFSVVNLSYESLIALRTNSQAQLDYLKSQLIL